MQETPLQPFDDPALKMALRRSLGKETAPVSLRDRIKKMAGENSSVSAPESKPDPKPIPLFRRSPVYRFAVAAVLIIGFGGLAYQIWQMKQKDDAYNRGTVFTASLYQNMIDTHEARKSATSADTITTLAAVPSLSGQVPAHAVFAADLTKDGWTFQGAAARKVGSDQAAQLFFTKGKSSISVFSLPLSAAPDAKEGESYDTVYNGAAIAGFRSSGGIFCIVGTGEKGPLDLTEVKQLLDEHKGEIRKG